MTPPVLEIEALTVSYDENPVLERVELTIDAGRLVGIVGPNGAGKSTLLKAMLGLIKHDAGHVSFFGQPLDKVRRRVVYVPQRSSVDWDFPVTVHDVVLMGRAAQRPWWARPSKKDRAVAAQAIDQLGLSDLAERPIGNLSGGQQQRTFLARALVQQGDLYVMDEPFVGVDAATEHVIIELLRGLRDEGKTVLVVNHDLSAVRNYFDDLLLLNKAVIAFGPTRDVFTTANLQTTYGGSLTLLQDGDQTTWLHAS